MKQISSPVHPRKTRRAVFCQFDTGDVLYWHFIRGLLISLQELKCAGASPIEMPSLDNFTLLLSHIVKPANHTA